MTERQDNIDSFIRCDVVDLALAIHECEVENVRAKQTILQSAAVRACADGAREGLRVNVAQIVKCKAMLLEECIELLDSDASLDRDLRRLLSSERILRDGKLRKRTRAQP